MTKQNMVSAQGYNGEVAEHRNSAGDSVDRIREIIFGEQIQDYSAKFEKIWDQLSTIDQRLEQIIEKIAEQERDLESQLENQKKKFEAELNQLDSDFSKQLADAAIENQERADALATSITTLGKSAKKDLTKATKELTDLKVDRAALGDMFALIGQSLTTGTMQSESSVEVSGSKSKSTKAASKSTSVKATSTRATSTKALSKSNGDA